MRIAARTRVTVARFSSVEFCPGPHDARHARGTAAVARESGSAQFWHHLQVGAGLRGRAMNPRRVTRAPPGPPASRGYDTSMLLCPALDALAGTLDLGSLLSEAAHRYGPYDLVAHWTQGEFHHDVVLRLPEAALRELPGRLLVVATNCNGGVKEVLSFAHVPDRWALWHSRCPDVADFSGDLAPILARSITPHWFDPCELLRPDARSELRAELRQRQRGGGWEPRGDGEGGCGRRREG